MFCFRPGRRWSSCGLPALALVVLSLAVAGCGSSASPASSLDAPDAAARVPSAAATPASSLVVRPIGHPALRGITGAKQRAARIRAIETHAGPSFKVQMQGERARLGAIALGLRGAPAVTSRSEHGNRVALQRGPDLTEWYQQGPLGLEQGFDVAKGDAEIVLHVAVTGATPVQAGDGEVALMDGTRVAGRYGEAYAFDAKGRALGVKLVAQGGGIEVRVAARGAVFPVEIDPLLWIEQGELTASDGVANDWFGYSVANAGDDVIVGARQANSSQGAAYVFWPNGPTWPWQQKLVASDGASNDYFGDSVAMSGSFALVGAPGSNSRAGAAYVFQRGSTLWNQLQKLTASDGSANDGFGNSVALDGATALVGAPGKYNSTLAVAGAAYVFVRNGVNWYAQQQELVPNDPGAADNFGNSVALSGDTALVGAWDKNSGAGAAYVFVRSGTTWTQQKELVVAQGGAFGFSVALSGDTALIGTESNSAYTSVRSGTSWSQPQKLVPGDGTAIDAFGVSVALSGDTALVGASQKAFDTGAAYVFLRSGTTWTQQRKLLAGDGVTNDYFGTSVALSSSSLAVVGAPRKSSKTGAAYVFVLSNSVADGASCPLGGPRDCSSGICADGVCCDTACDQACQSCSATPGTCTAVTNADDPGTCNGTNTCDASGACKKKDGQTCSAASECASGFCADGFCCDSACSGGCDVCDATPGTCTVLANGNPGANPVCSPYVCGGAANCPVACTSDSNCDAGDYCDAAGACVAQKVQASTCNSSAGADCMETGCRVCGTAGNCVDGFCCDTTCPDACDRCDGAALGWSGATNGTCAVAPAGYPGTPACGAYVCTGASATCNGAQCSSDAGCSPGYYCDAAGACVDEKPQRATCNPSADCKSGNCRVCATGNCVDGYCCDTACSGACDACDATPGTCTLRPSGAACGGYTCNGTSASCPTACGSDTDCATGYYCNASGACAPRKSQGTTCDPRAGKDCMTADCRVCTTGNCVDSVCCDTACNGTCQACSAAKKGSGSDGTCGTVADGTDPDSECAPNTCHAGQCASGCTTSADCAQGTVCVGGGCITPAAQGAKCNSNLACQSGNCVDGYCCDTTCTGQCEACDVTGSEGTCSPVEANGQPHGTRAPCKGDGSKCSGACDGKDRTQCQYLPANTSCGADSCANGSAQTSECDGQGTCVAKKPQACSPYVCGADACLTTCTQDTDCTTNYQCKKGSCTPATSGATCKDANTERKADGTLQPCGAYLCNDASGTCFQVCNGSTECATGYACDPTSKTCQKTSTGTGSNSSGGCGCRAAGSTPGSDAPWLVLLGLGLLVVRRHRD